MATKDASIVDLCARVQKLVPKSIGSETWYLIVVSSGDLPRLLCAVFTKGFVHSSLIFIIANHRPLPTIVVSQRNIFRDGVIANAALHTS
jgi:hypothetical protein